MEITRHNYESWFLDYYEERLNPEEKQKLQQFLLINTDLTDEFLDFSLIGIDSAPLCFEGKEQLKFENQLKGNCNRLNFNTHCIAYYEGDLDTNQVNGLKTFIEKNKSYQPVFEQFGKLKLQVNETEKFPNKARLKHKRVVAIPSNIIVYAIGIAASLLLFVYVAINFEKPVSQHFTQQNVLKSGNPATNKLEKELKNKTVAEIKTRKEIGKNSVQKNTLATKKNKVTANNPVEENRSTSPNLLEPLAMKLEAKTEKLVLSSSTNDKLFSEKIETENNDYPTLSQYALRKLRKTLGNGDENLAQNLLEKGINKLEKNTGGKVNYKHKKEKDRNVFTFAIGPLEYYRSRN
jgi:hypothetical protein